MLGITFCPSNVKPKNIEGKRANLLTENIAYKNNEQSGPVFQSSCKNEEHVFPSWGLVNLLTISYCRHYKIVLRPEDIWMAIQAQFTIYVNIYSEELRHKFVKHEGKKQLVVTDLEVLSQDISVMSLKMVEKMEEHLQDEKLVNWILPKFSTTTFHDINVFAISAMGTLNNYFDYRFELSCGLPEVTLLGTLQDWQEIKARAEQLMNYELEFESYMKEWTDLLLPVLDKFIETAQGAPDLEWWNRVCHRYSGGSGPSYLTGWVTVFNVFSNKGNWLARKRDDSWRHVQNSEWPLVNYYDICYGFTSFNVTIDNNGDKFVWHMYAGCMGANIKDNTLLPRLDWGVVRQTNALVENGFKSREEASEKKRK